MSWITLLWSMDAAFCFTAAGIYLLIWSKRRQNWVYLLFSSSALATGIIAELELIGMHAQTTAQYSAVLRWAQLPIWMLTLSIVWFGRLYLRAGRLWLAWCVCGVRTLALLLNFLFPPNLNFREITSLGHLSWWGGETVSVAVGVPNPWSLIGQLSTVLLLIFFVDATIAVWRRGEQRRALLVGGSAILVITLALVQSVLVIWGAVQWPFINSVPYLGIIAAMGYELSYDFLRAAKLAQDFQTSEAALRESEARINIATNAANLGLWLWNIPGDQLRVTQKWRELFGFPDSEPVTFDRLLQLVHPEDRERMKQLVQQMFEHGGEYESEYRISRPDGSTRWILGYGSVELDERGKPAFARGVSRDITTRKLAEEELRESEERFRTVANAAPVLIWMSGPDRLCTFFNKGWLDFTGRSLEQELGNGWAEGVHLEDLDRCLDVYQNSFNARESFTMEYRLRRSDGEYRWVLDSGTPRFAPDGAFLGYIGSCIDITERKSSEEQFRLVLDAAPNAMIMVDSAGVINFANASAATVFGYSFSELIGCQIEMLIPERFRAQHPGYRKHFVSHPSGRAMGVGRDLFGRRKDGSEFPVEVGLSPMRTTRGVFVLASLIDITARKAAEVEVRQRREQVELLGRVSLLGEMTASLAHELNQPLAAIVNNATAAMQYIEQGKLDPEQLQEILTDVVGDSRRAHDIMRNVRSEIKKGSAIRGRINLNDVVKAVTHMVHLDAAAHFCKVEMSLARNLPAIEGDPSQIQQVLINLIRNAFDAMRDTPPSGRKVEIATTYNGDGTICVAVRDYGSGIPELTPERLFEQFFTTKEQGLGMGLAI